MPRSEKQREFVVTAVRSAGDASEFRQSMTPHPLVHQELPYQPWFGVYNRRLRSLRYRKVPMEELYWRLRRDVGLAHTGELATEIRGPDAEPMLNRIFTGDVSRVRVGRCSYQLACFADGGMVMDGILLRLAEDRFWYTQGDGEFRVWLRAHTVGFDVEIQDADVWVSQVQGPRALDVLEEASDEGLPENFRYFDMARIHIGAQPVVISRTGFTNELGWELYIGSDADAGVIGDRIMEAGKQYRIHTIPAEATNARRIEAGLLFAGTDFDHTVDPFAAGLGAFVDLGKDNFIGRDALARTEQRQRTWGMTLRDGIARRGDTLRLDGKPAGRVCSTAWSPYLQRGIAIVRLNSPEHLPGTQLDVDCADGRCRTGAICELPMYDRNREIPRGKVTDIPSIPGSN